MATTDRKLGRRDGIRFAITWLHARAKTMNDPTAVAVLNVAASDLGNQLSRFEVVNPEAENSVQCLSFTRQREEIVQIAGLISAAVDALEAGSTSAPVVEILKATGRAVLASAAPECRAGERALAELKECNTLLLAVRSFQEDSDVRREIKEQVERNRAILTLTASPPSAEGCDRISFPRWWIQHLYTGLNRINTANVPGPPGDFIFTLRHQLLDALNKPAAPLVAEPGE